MASKVKRLGILTGGGDCPGLNAVIRAVIKTAINEYEMEVIGFRDGYEGVMKNSYHKLDHKDASGIIFLGGTILGTPTWLILFVIRRKEKAKKAVIQISRTRP